MQKRKTDETKKHRKSYLKGKKIVFTIVFSHIFIQCGLQLFTYFYIVRKYLITFKRRKKKTIEEHALHALQVKSE